MSFERDGGMVLGRHRLAELRLVYRSLHRQLAHDLELLDCDFLGELQRFLHEAARADGVDTSHHAAWDAWLAKG